MMLLKFLRGMQIYYIFMCLLAHVPSDVFQEDCEATKLPDADITCQELTDMFCKVVDPPDIFYQNACLCHV